MEEEKQKAIIEAILFAAGRAVSVSEIMSCLELSSKQVISVMDKMKQDYEKEDRGIELIRIEEGYQLATKKSLYEYLYPVFDRRAKPSLSQASLETLAIIAYNPRITRADIDSIRGVNSDGTIYKLLDYNLIEPAGKLDAPGRPMTYKVTSEFMKLFSISSLNDLPTLPKYKLDSNRQIVIDEIIDEKNEAPIPERVENQEQILSIQEKKENKDE